MAKFTKTELKKIVEFTPTELVGKQISKLKGVYVGYWTPKDTNWSYQVYAVPHPSKTDYIPDLVVVQFGGIVDKI